MEKLTLLSQPTPYVIRISDEGVVTITYLETQEVRALDVDPVIALLIRAAASSGVGVEEVAKNLFKAAGRTK